MHDLIIRNGTVVDGSGNARVIADVAIDGERITAIGHIDDGAHRTIDATGCLVTPGWVDVHTHYDGQATWDPILAPSSWHGVTTVVMGNCGVGFAPVRPGKEGFLIELMEGVEDIPGAALAEGIDWRWESFAQYLDALEELPRTIDIATQVPHGAVRAYVMGERCNTIRRSANAGRNRADGGDRARRHQSGRAGLFEFAHAAAQGQTRRTRTRHVRRQRRNAGAGFVDERPRPRRVRTGVRPPRQRRRMGVGHAIRARKRAAR